MVMFDSYKYINFSIFELEKDMNAINNNCPLLAHGLINLMKCILVLFCASFVRSIRFFMIINIIPKEFLIILFNLI